MARLRAKEKALFYPTPLNVMDIIVSNVSPAHVQATILDPCAGTGEPLAYLADHLGLISYGNELDPGRFEQAKSRLAYSLCGPRELLEIEGQFNILFNNPPYDQSLSGERMEMQHIRFDAELLCEGGLGIWVLPESIFSYELCSLLSTHLSELIVRRFPMPEYEQFKQVVVFGRKRRKSLDHYNGAYYQAKDLESAIQAGSRQLQWSEYSFKYSTESIEIARFDTVLPAIVDVLAEADQYGVDTTPAWQTLFGTDARPVDTFQPVLPLTSGHMAFVIAAGIVDGTEVEIDGDAHIIKGSTEKQLAVTVKAEAVAAGTKQTVRERQRLAHTLAALNIRNGSLIEYNSLEDIDGFSAFLLEHQNRLVQMVDDTYPPLFEPDRDMPAWVDKLGLVHAPGQLPGQQTVNGLLPAQEVRAAALATKLKTDKAVVLVGEMGSGKATSLDAKILTPTGWTTMGQIKVGDRISRVDGGEGRVIGVYPQGVKDMYRVTFNDGSSVECCKEHLWAVRKPIDRWRGKEYYVKSLQEIMGEGLELSTPGNRKWFIPMVAPIEFEEVADLRLHPYVLGCLLGDGQLRRSIVISSIDQELLDTISGLLPDGVELRYSSGCDYRLSRMAVSGPNPVIDAFRHYSLLGTVSHTKFIPQEYLFSSVKTRISLLRGLMDTDGHADRCGAEFVSVSRQLALDVQFLVQSLGGKATLSTKKTTYTYNGVKKNGKLAYRLYISTAINPFSLSRKSEAYVIPTKYEPTRAIVSVEYSGQKEAQCIAVDSSDNLYVTDEFIVTHNTCLAQAVAALVGKGNWKLVVVCPSQIVHKWKREAEKVLRSFAVQVHIIGRKYKQSDGEGKLRKVSKPVLDVTAAMEEENPSILVMSYETAKNGPRWEHAVLYRNQPFTRQVEEEVITKSDYFPYECKEIVTKEVTVVQEVVGCPDCGFLLMDERMLYITRAELGRRKQFCPGCDAALWQQVPFKYGGRTAIADFLNRHYSGRYNLILDECHHTKGADTDAGYASSDLVAGARKVIAMTGTIYAGKASTIFHLLYRLLPRFRQLYAYNEMQRFIDHHGLQETITTTTPHEQWSSAYGYSRENVRTREIAGVSPGMVTMLLGNTAFIKLADMGLNLPSYVEERLPIPLDERLEAGIKDIADIYGEAALLARRGMPGLLSSWLYASLGWMDCPVDELLEGRDRKGEVVASYEIEGIIDAKDELLDDPLSKDVELIHLISGELAQGRGVGVYFSQVNRRDWMPRIHKLLKAEGIYSEVLRQGTCKPDQRELWYQEMVERSRLQGQEPVLLANGNLVKEGLDLIELPTIIETGIEYRINDLRQRDRRSWRLTQDRPVKVIFLYYEDSPQEAALQLVAAKLKAALMVDGNLAEGLAAMDVDDGNLMDALMKAVSQRKRPGSRWDGMAVSRVIDVQVPEPDVVALKEVKVGDQIQYSFL